MTSNHVLIYRVEFNNEDCYQLVDPRDGTLKRVSQVVIFSLILQRTR